MKKLIIFILLILIISIYSYFSIFICNATEYVILTQFGKVSKIIKKPQAPREAAHGCSLEFYIRLRWMGTAPC